MAKSAGQKKKLLVLAKLFMEYTDDEHGLSTGRILSELSARGIAAERKSIYDDVDTLRSCGMDIVLRRADEWEYFLASREFQLPELKLLVDAVQSSRFITSKKSGELIHKLEQLASRYEAGALQRQVYVTGRIKTMNESIYYNIDKLHAAIGANRQISFCYFSWTVQKKKQLRREGARYRVSPYALIWDDEYYYLVAYEEQNQMLRHYRVDKMQSIRVEEEKRTGQEAYKRFDPALYSRGMFGMFGGEESQVTLRFAAGLVGVVLDRFGTDVVLTPQGEDTFTFSVKVAVSPQFFGWIFGFGKDARIVAPAAVVDCFAAYAAETLAQYNSTEEA